MKKINDIRLGKPLAFIQHGIKILHEIEQGTGISTCQMPTNEHLLECAENRQGQGSLLIIQRR